MTNPLSYQPSHSAAFYTPPSRIHLGRTVAGFAMAAALAVAGSIIYAKIQPEILSPIARAGSAAAGAVVVGLLAVFVARFGRLRIAWVAAALGALIALLVLYVIWIVWIHDLLRHATAAFTYPRLIESPWRLFRLLRTINRYGTWTYHGDIIRGVPLLVLWLGEASLILAAGVLFPLFNLYTDDPICRDCGRKCVAAPGLPRFATERQDEFLASVESRDFAAMSSHPAAIHEDAPELSLRLMSCPACGGTNVLTVSRIAWQIPTGTGRPTVKIVPLIDQLLITPDETAQVKAVCQSIKNQRAAVKDNDFGQTDHLTG